MDSRRETRRLGRIAEHLSRHRRDWLRAFVVVLLVGLVYLLGWIRGEESAQHSEISVTAMQRELDSLSVRLDEAERARTEAELAAQISEVALNDLRQQIVQWREAEARLQQEVSFYRSLIEPEAVANIISIDDFLLLATAEPGVYRYELLVVQRGRDQERFRGAVAVRLFGTLGGEPRALEASDLALDARELELDFSYFQRLSGTLRLPENFTPLEAIAAVYPEGDPALLVEKTVNWPDAPVPGVNGQ